MAVEGRQDDHLRRASLRLRPSPPAGVRHQHARLERRPRRDRARVDPAAGRARHLGAAGEEDIGRADGGCAARRPPALRTIRSEGRRREEEPRSRRQHDRRPRMEARLSDRALRAHGAPRDRRRERRWVPRRARAPLARDPRSRGSRQAADGDRRAQAGEALQAPQAPAVEHVDQRAADAAQSDHAARRGLRPRSRTTR